MTSDQIKTQLINQRDETAKLVEQLQTELLQLDNAITALTVATPAKRRGRPPKLEVAS